MPNPTILSKIRRIQRLSVGELQREWAALYDGEPCRSRNRLYLVKRLCWRIQELEFGGLSEHAKKRIDELAPDNFVRARTPTAHAVLKTGKDHESPASPRRDPRLPTVGTVLAREYRGQELQLTVLDDGFEVGGTVYGSLSEAARAVTGSKWNGRLFWGLTQRKRR